MKLPSSLPRTLFIIAVLLLLAAIQFGTWQVATAGWQVRVPMFYDTHYVFPRPWTQAQEVPQRPNPAPIAIYEHNQLSQTWRSGSSRLSHVRVWLWSTEGAPATVSLAVGDAVYETTVLASERGYYDIALPQPATNILGDPIQLVVRAADATADAPLYLRTIGGDRLGGVLRLNQFPQAATLDLQTYTDASLGNWWRNVLGEQLLASVFRVRLQQYKPPFLKGGVLSSLLIASALLSGLFIWVSLPATLRSKRFGWSLGTLLIVWFLVWQLNGERLVLGGAEYQFATADTLPLPALTTDHTLSQNLASTLWLADRKPEERFFDTKLGRDREGRAYAQITLPHESTLIYALRIPFNSYLRTKPQRKHTNMPADELPIRLREASVFVGGTELEGVVDGDTLIYDLTPFGGQTEQIILQSYRGTAHSAWALPQIETRTDWLQPYQGESARYQFADDIELIAIAQENDTIELTWHANRPTTQRATVFIHVLNAQGELIAQHDGEPVQNTYPIPLWQPNVLVKDVHPMGELPPGTYDLAIGLYDPVTQIRYAAYDAAGNMLPNDQVVLSQFVISAE